MQLTTRTSAPDATPSDSDAPSLEDLVFAVACGDGGALALLYQETHRRLRSILLTRLRCREDAEEVLFDIFACVWESADSYDSSRGSVRAWLGIIARNKCIDRVRSRYARTSLSVEVYSANADSIESDWYGPEDLLLQSQISASVHRALQTLSPLRRHIVALAFFAGWAHPEIARSLHLPLGTVKSHLRRGLSSLRVHVSPLVHHRFPKLPLRRK